MTENQHRWLSTISALIAIAAFLTGVSSLPQFIDFINARGPSTQLKVTPDERENRSSSSATTNDPMPPTDDSDSGATNISPQMAELLDLFDKDYQSHEMGYASIKGASGSPEPFSVDYNRNVARTPAGAVIVQFDGRFFVNLKQGYITISAIAYSSYGIPAKNPAGEPLKASTKKLLTDDFGDRNFAISLYLGDNVDASKYSYRLEFVYNNRSIYTTFSPHP